VSVYGELVDASPCS